MVWILIIIVAIVLIVSSKKSEEAVIKPGVASMIANNGTNVNPVYGKVRVDEPMGVPDKPVYANLMAKGGGEGALDVAQGLSLSLDVVNSSPVVCMPDTWLNTPADLRYLNEHPDVAAAVIKGQYSSGHHHFMLIGQALNYGYWASLNEPVQVGGTLNLA